MTGDAPLRVIVADDHPVFRQGIHAALAAEPDIEVVGEAADGNAVIAEAARHDPDVILMDIRMPGVNGIEATRRILEHRPEVRVLVLTMFEDDASVFDAIRAGARGYLLKGSEPGDISRAVRAVAQGDAIFGPAIAGRLMTMFARRGDQPFNGLTQREHSVLALIAEGRNNHAIARELDLSLKTVRNYVSTIFNKLQVADRAEAMLKARSAGLGGERE
jgi:DNA-binding NarL/FixJ family response regulator